MYHPLKATERSISQEHTAKAKQRVHIPQCNLQSYGEFIPATIAYLLTYSLIAGGAS